MQTLQHQPQRNSLTKSELIAGYLQQMALPSMWHRVLSESDYELWDTVLDPYSLPAIKFAFDTWVGGAKRFPAPSDILPLCASYAEQQAISQHRKVVAPSAKSGGLSPELVIILLPEIIARAERYHAKGFDPAPPIEEHEVEGMVQQAKQRQQKVHNEVARFPNGNARYNRELTQARALSGEWRR